MCTRVFPGSVELPGFEHSKCPNLDVDRREEIQLSRGMASAMARTLSVCRASSLARVSGALSQSSSSSGRNWTRNRCGELVGNGGDWRLMRFFCREFSNERRVRAIAARGPVRIVAATKRGAAAAVREQVEDEETQDDEDDDDAEGREKEKPGRNVLKKQSARAKEWGRELAALSPAQLRQACKWAGLDEDVYDAVMLVKNLGSSSRVKHGRRRQYNYIGGLLRDADAETMESVLKATKDGDVEGLVFIPSKLPEEVDAEAGWDEESEEEEEESEEDDAALEEAKSWVQGMVAGVRAVEDEVYSIYDVEFDRQELRKLVREARTFETEASAASGDAGEAEGGVEVSKEELSALKSKSERAERKLLQFLLKIVKERRDNVYYTDVQ
ncbi:hypothetical protein Mp_4g13110 [Marchantia polymorpha subsp. ruderalis]|uniref:Uncharacterized protein n=2 Tax=Marchantia polymorpha TaxID=3197 RepID=A0AAF6B9F0_MARPO|nr:hypothetical protein MARPO_0138s0045 [Marchantia polymorpha]BBN08634.1 hypothetical protein Mp_4g13110 [Marchantia polymorpha subsp. ruderalis]|eukprot:PTQ29619.1 hypothetical protein MARPO_0138s0045 [Marchantia polymorpha]